MKKKLLIYALLLALYIALANAIDLVPLLAVIVMAAMSHIFCPIAIIVIMVLITTLKELRYARPNKVCKVIFAILVSVLWFTIPISIILANLEILGKSCP